MFYGATCYDNRVVDNRSVGRKQAVEKVLGPLEGDIMKVVWSAKQPLTVREVLAILNDGRKQQLAYTTVMTVMSRLAEKRVLKREQQGRGFAYAAAVTDAAGIAVKGVIEDFGEAAVAQFVDAARADPKLLRRLEKLLRDKEK